ncbi:MAG: alpha-1,2-fucosyltransferase [Bacteroidetes bacterium]|nr:alpha-1,2-fucosyltransferase [Bacteroidota bacterium]
MIVVKIQNGLGNQLFQYATARALSIFLNTELKVDLQFYEDPKNENAYRLFKFNLPIFIATQIECNSLKSNIQIPKLYKLLSRLGYQSSKYYKTSHLFESKILALYYREKRQLKDYYIEGWFGNEKYFFGIKDLLVNELNANSLLNSKNQITLEEINKSNSVSIHIRRGDYLNNPFFTNLSNTYYNNSIKRLLDEIENPIFYFFSNDINWVKNEFSKTPNSIFIDNNSFPDTHFSNQGDIEDLMLMRSCKHQIIANSTFSWWGAWLNQNPEKIVIAPKKWYDNEKAQKEYESSDFIPKEWIKI